MAWSSPRCARQNGGDGMMAQLAPLQSPSKILMSARWPLLARECRRQLRTVAGEIDALRNIGRLNGHQPSLEIAFRAALTGMGLAF